MLVDQSVMVRQDGVALVLNQGSKDELVFVVVLLGLVTLEVLS